MTTIAEARQAVYDRFEALWIFSGSARTPFVFANEPSKLDSGSVSWARVSVRETGGGLDALGAPGARKYRRAASTFVQIYTEAGSGGEQAASDLSHEARTIFEGESFSGLDFNDGQVREIANDDGRWKQTNVEIEFFYDEVK